jgi:hypothetical protein
MITLFFRHLAVIQAWVTSGDCMNLITTLNVDPLLALNLEPIFQLTFVSLIMLAGPVVVFLLFLRGGDL